MLSTNFLKRKKHLDRGNTHEYPWISMSKDETPGTKCKQGGLQKKVAIQGGKNNSKNWDAFSDNNSTPCSASHSPANSRRHSISSIPGTANRRASSPMLPSFLDRLFRPASSGSGDSSPQSPTSSNSSSSSQCWQLRRGGEQKNEEKSDFLQFVRMLKAYQTQVGWKCLFVDTDTHPHTCIRY